MSGPRNKHNFCLKNAHYKNKINWKLKIYIYIYKLDNLKKKTLKITKHLIRTTVQV